MTNEWKEEFFQELLRQAKLITEAAEISPSGAKGEGPMLVAHLTTVTDGTGACVFETEIIEEFPDEPQLEILVTLPFAAKDDDAFNEVSDAIMQMNLFVPMGFFGYYYPSDQVYFRVAEFIDENKPIAVLAEEVIERYKKSAMIVGNMFGALERLATGESNFEEEVENGTLPSQE